MLDKALQLLFMAEDLRNADSIRIKAEYEETCLCIYPYKQVSSVEYTKPWLELINPGYALPIDAL